MSAKLYVRFRESGEVFDVDKIINIPEIGHLAIYLYCKEAIFDIDCDLCDEQGRLLKPEDLDEMYLNMQYYMEYCQAKGYVTPQDWLEKHKHFGKEAKERSFENE